MIRQTGTPGQQREQTVQGLRWLALAWVLSACAGSAPGDGVGGESGTGGAPTEGNGGTSSAAGGATAGTGAQDSSGGGFPTGSGGIAPATGGDTNIDYELCVPEPTLDLMTPGVTVQLAPVEDAPTPLGGTLLDGVYDITSYVFYGNYPVDGFMGGFREVVRIRDNATGLDILRTDFSSLYEIRAAIAPIEPATASMDLTFECPSELLGRVHAQPYTSTANELAFFEERDGVLSVITLVRRQ